MYTKRSNGQIEPKQKKINVHHMKRIMHDCL